MNMSFGMLMSQTMKNVDFHDSILFLSIPCPVIEMVQVFHYYLCFFFFSIHHCYFRYCFIIMADTGYIIDVIAPIPQKPHSTHSDSVNPVFVICPPQYEQNNPTTNIQNPNLIEE